MIDHWSDETREGTCRREWCDVDITLGNFVWRHGEFFVSHPRVLHTYRRLGGRYAWIFSTIRVRDGTVWEKNIQLYVASISVPGPDGGRFDYTLIGRAGSGPLNWTSPQHPEYRFGGPGGGCDGCTEGSVVFTPFADPADVRRLMDLNFDCITRWHPCTERAEILPTAWKELQAEMRIRKEDHGECTPAMIRVLSREAQRVPLAIVIRVEHSGDGYAVTVHREGNPNDLIFAYQPREYTFAEPASVVFRKGDRLLLLDDGCYAVKATEENLKAAQLGVSEDRSVQMKPAYLPSFGAIHLRELTSARILHPTNADWKTGLPSLPPPPCRL